MNRSGRTVPPLSWITRLSGVATLRVFISCKSMTYGDSGLWPMARIWLMFGTETVQTRRHGQLITKQVFWSCSSDLDPPNSHRESHSLSYGRKNFSSLRAVVEPVPRPLVTAADLVAGAKVYPFQPINVRAAIPHEWNGDSYVASENLDNGASEVHQILRSNAKLIRHWTSAVKDRPEMSQSSRYAYTMRIRLPRERKPGSLDPWRIK